MRIGVALLISAAVVGRVQGAGIGFRNDAKVPVIVQGASIVNNMLRRGQPLLIPPGKVAWDLNLKPGVRYITIYHGALPNRILYQGPPFNFAGQDAFFSVQHTPRNPFQLWLVPMAVPPK
jgi:hypothetical protein